MLKDYFSRLVPVKLRFPAKTDSYFLWKLSEIVDPFYVVVNGQPIREKFMKLLKDNICFSFPEPVFIGVKAITVVDLFRLIELFLDNGILPYYHFLSGMEYLLHTSGI